MTIKISAYGAKLLLGHATGPVDKSLRTLFGSSTDFHFGLLICQGSVPLYPESPVSSSDVLATFPTTLGWGNAAITGYTAYLAKESAAWTCSSVTNTGIATFFRLYDPAENGYGDDLTDKHHARIQGTVGEDSTYDLVVADAYYVAATSRTIDNFRIYLF